MGAIADFLALFGLLALTAVFVAGFMDETEPGWRDRSLRERIAAMPLLLGVLALLWVLALFGWLSGPARFLAWVAGWTHGAVLQLAALLGVAGLGAGLLLLIRPALATRAGPLQRHLCACQMPYVVLILGLGALQAGLGSR